MSKPIILVTGAGGQLGKELQVIASEYPEYEFVFVTRAELPIDNPIVIAEYFSKVKPHFCVNCAAYTAVDRAESDKDAAFLVNGDSPGWLAAECRRYEARFIHISTDYVFNGIGVRPYLEDDLVEPVNAYGSSKLKGEESATIENPETIIIRTSWVYSRFGNNFVKTMLRLMKEREEVKVVNDQLGSPTYAADLAALILSTLR